MLAGKRLILTGVVTADSIAYAIAEKAQRLGAEIVLTADPAGVNLAFQTSAYSYATLGRLLADLAPEDGGALLGLDFDADRAWPAYNWMGVCKAALEAVNRYLARDLGPRHIRANLIAAGPLHTRAAAGIPGFHQLLDAWEQQAPMAWNPHDPAPVADVACFLLSDLARAITGEILHVDRGYHAIAAALAAEAAGVAQRAMEMAVEYAKDRKQFDRPIGANQAVSHRCAQMLLEVEGARSATYWAAWAIDHEPDTARRAASVAKAYASDAGFRVCASAIQVHGGIGFTWEHDLHFFFKRAKANAYAFGDARWHRDKVAELAGI